MNQRHINHSYIKVAIIFTIIAFFSFPSFSAKVFPIHGVVTDDETGEHLSFVTVQSNSPRQAVVTDDNGVFKLNVVKGAHITVSALGYETKTTVIDDIPSDTLRISLYPMAIVLAEVTVGRTKNKYSKKNNPAVDLMQDLRRHRNISNPVDTTYYSYSNYEKMVLGLNNYDRKTTLGGVTKKMDFLQNYVDTAKWTGAEVLDLMLKEKLTTRIHKNGDNGKEVVTAYRSVGVDEEANQQNMRVTLEDLMDPINLYENDIKILQNRFVSPLSTIADDFYRFFITDTLTVDHEPCIELSFAPKTPETWGFNGKIFIPLNDTVRYPKRVTMRIPKHINANFVKNLFISQNYSKDSLGKVHKTLDDITMTLQLAPGTPELFASRQSVYDNFSYSYIDSLNTYYDKLGDSFDMPEADNRGDLYWNENRPISLTNAEANLGSIMHEARRIPLIYWGEKTIRTLTKGYVPTWNPSKFDIGPVLTFLSHNKAEGWRVKFGGMTTANLSPHVFARGYVAYSFGDKKLKYSGELEYSFNEKKYHSREFPVKSIRASYTYDKDQLGQEYMNGTSGTLLTSLNRNNLDLLTYRRLATLDYNLELENRLSFKVGYNYETQQATPWVKFIDGNNQYFNSLNQSYFEMEIRYAPGEKYFQTNNSRKAVNYDAPVFTIRYKYSPKGLLGADFERNSLEFHFKKRFWLSAFGYLHTQAQVGKIFSKVQFPALFWQSANTSYTIQNNSFTLMNPMEFAMDQYAMLHVSYFANGALFSRIPVIKKLKLREILIFKGCLGKLTDKNNPEKQQDLFRFPEEANTRPIGNKPYMEVGVGIDNILSFFRLDYYWRLTYLDAPGIDKRGLRVGLHLEF